MLASRPRLLVFLAGGAALLLDSVPARAAFETQVLTAAEKGSTLDLNLSVGYDRFLKQAKITREWIQSANGMPPQALDVKELRYTEMTQVLNLQLRVGLYHDLEFHMIAPIVLASETRIAFASGVEGFSTIIGSANADDPNYAGTPRYPITGVPQERQRAGFGDMTFGLSWSPFVDRKDEAYPTVTLRTDIIAPTGSTRDPTDQNALPGGSGGSVGLGETIFDLSLAVSRRMRTETPLLDPYMVFGAQIPVANPKQKELGMTPPPSGKFTVGTELVVYDDPERSQSYGLDLSFSTRYVGAGRTYSELSDYLPNFNQRKVLQNRTDQTLSPDAVVYSDFDKPANYASQLDGASCGKIKGVPCGELTAVDEYLEMKAAIALNLKLAKYFFIRGGVAFQHDTDHFLTNEKVGTDVDPASAAGQTCDGSDCLGRVNARNSNYDRVHNLCPEGKTCDERSEYYDPRYDAPGRRFRIGEVTNFVVFVTGAATF